MKPVSWRREESRRNPDPEKSGDKKRADCHEEGRDLMIQYDLKAALIEIEKPVKGLAEILSDAAVFLFRNMLQQISGKHPG